MWLTELKIAIIEKDTKRLDALLDHTPQMESIQEIEEAIYLLREANEMMQYLKDETAASMKQIKKNVGFLDSTHVQTKRQIDIKL